MDVLTKYLHPLYQAPDTPAAAADPPAPPPADPGAADPPAPDPIGDPAPPAPAMIPQSVFVREVTPLRAKVRETETALEQAQRTIREQNEMLARLQAKPGEDPAPPVRATPQPGTDEFNRAVDKAAFEREFTRNTGDVRSAGMAKFPDFQATLGVLEALGVTNNQVILDLLSADKANAHIILDQLAKSPEKATAIASMDQPRRIAEFIRMAPVTAAAAKTEPAAPTAQPARTVSRAPAPPPPVDPGTKKELPPYADELSDEDFTAQFNERMAKRSARR
jgi:hypothetical protein